MDFFFFAYILLVSGILDCDKIKAQIPFYKQCRGIHLNKAAVIILQGTCEGSQREVSSGLRLAPSVQWCDDVTKGPGPLHLSAVLLDIA